MGNMGAAPGTWHPGEGPAATTAHTVQGWSLGRREGRVRAWRVEQISHALGRSSKCSFVAFLAACVHLLESARGTCCP